MRHLNEIKKLPIDQLTDEEIVKVVQKRFNAQLAALIYMDEDGKKFFIVRYKNREGKSFWMQMFHAWAKMFGEIRKLKNDDED